MAMIRTNRREQRGETLLEIVIAIVVIAIVFSAFFASYSTAARSSTTQRTAAQVDAILRNAAESTKQAVRRDCATRTASTPGATYSPTLPSVPTGFGLTVSASPAGNNCPAIPTAGMPLGTTSCATPCLQDVTFTVTSPGAAARTLTIEVRTP
jgi:prepilin-type N-terminal cleavage/methylation domain-containing protein